MILAHDVVAKKNINVYRIGFGIMSKSESSIYESMYSSKSYNILTKSYHVVMSSSFNTSWWTGTSKMSYLLLYK